MLRLSKLTDYGIVLLTYLARHHERKTYTARDLSAESHVPVPTVNKVLKELSRAGLLVSHRGRSGGYGLARAPETITVAQIVAALEGPVGLTECTVMPGVCKLEPHCPDRAPWRAVSKAIREALEKLSLAAMAHPPVPTVRLTVDSEVA